MGNYSIILNMHKIGSSAFGNASIRKVITEYVDSLLTDQNCDHEEIKLRLKAGNSCHYLAQFRLTT